MMMHAGSEEAALAALVDAATHGLLLLSSTGTILRSNDAAAHLLGTTRDALRHRHLDQVLSRTGWEPGFLAQALATGGVVSRAYDLGTGRKALISARTTKAAPGEAPLVAITIQDVSSLGALVSRLDEKAPSSRSRASDSRRASVPNDEADGLIAESPALRAVKAKALEFAGVPFTGAGSWTVSVCRRKGVANSLLAHAGLPVPEFVVAHGRIPDDFPLPAIVKPAAEDASAGLDRASVVTDRKSLKARVAAMTEQFDEVLVQRYVAGREFNLPILEVVTGVPGVALLPLLDEAARAQVIEPGDAFGHYRFSHRLIQETLYDELPAARRFQLHSQLGAALEGLHAADLREHYGTIAHHYAQAPLADNIDKAIAFATQAGTRGVSVWLDNRTAAGTNGAVADVYTSFIE